MYVICINQIIYTTLLLCFRDMENMMPFFGFDFAKTLLLNVVYIQ